MKTEHRHELKTNDLAEWLLNFPRWAQENARMLIYIAVVIVLVAGSYIYRNYTRNVLSVRNRSDFTSLVMLPWRSKIQIIQSQAATGTDTSYMLIQTANNLNNIAGKTKNSEMAALALIKQAETLRSELHYRLDSAPEQDVLTQIEKAKNIYNQALEKSAGNNSLAAKAKLGIGLCEEEINNFDRAGQIYNEIITNDSFKNTTAAVAAKWRLAEMDEYRKEVIFKQPAPQEQTQAPLVPIKAGLPDINLPDN